MASCYHSTSGSSNGKGESKYTIENLRWRAEQVKVFWSKALSIQEQEDTKPVQSVKGLSSAR